MPENYIIEARTSAGALDFADPQPERYFGVGAIHGMTADQIAKVVFNLLPELPAGVMRGDNVPLWPALVDPRFVARVKTW